MQTVIAQYQGSLDTGTAKALVYVFVTSRVDCCNTMFAEY